MGLVELKQNEIYADSSVIARKFGMQHAKVVRTIERLLPKIEKLRVTDGHPKITTEEREYRGQGYTAYLLNRNAFVLTMMRFDTSKAIQWQMQFIEAFNQMERTLIIEQSNKSNPEWLPARIQSKIGRKAETDVIKKFTEYCEKQGSTKAGFYYGHITKATYKGLGLMMLKKPKLRDTLDLYELSQLILAEKLVRDKLTYYMKKERHYKDIYSSVRDDLLEFGTAIKSLEIKSE